MSIAMTCGTPFFSTWTLHGEVMTISETDARIPYKFRRFKSSVELQQSSSYGIASIRCGGGRKSFGNKKHVQLPAQKSIDMLLSTLSREDGNVVSDLDHYSRWLELADWFTVLEELGKRDRWLLTLEVFRWMQQQRWYKPDDGFYAKLISILGKKGELRLAIWLFKEMRKQGCRPDTSVYNSIITAHLKSNDREVALAKAFSFFEQMKRKARCQPNLVTYNILLRACAQARHLEKIDELFKEMDRSGFRKDIYTFNGMLDAYGKAGYFLEMELVLKDMKAAKCKPDFITFNTVIDAYGKAGVIVKMEQALKSMAKSKVKPQLSTFNSLINNYGNAGHIEEMELVFQNMAVLGIRPTLITYEVMMKGYGNTGCLAKMRSFFDTMSSDGIKPEVSTLNALMEVYCSQGLVADAEALLDRSYRMGMQPTALSYLIVFKGYLKQKSHGNMEILMKKMEAAGVKPNENFLIESIEAYTLEPQPKGLVINNDVREPALSQ